MSEKYPLIMTEEYWANSQLSIVRYYGHIRFMGHEYVIVNRDGIDIFALSIMAEKQGKDKAIEPGEPCDLCLKSLVTSYHKLGRAASSSLSSKARPRKKSNKSQKRKRRNDNHHQ